jgi:hypothetical protein
MKVKLVAVLGLTLCCNSVLGGEAAQPELRIRPIQIISCDTLPEALPWNIKPPLHEPGFQIYYLVEGTGIAGISSLVIDTIKTPDGVDISKHRSGRLTYKLGSFPPTSANGKYALFSLYVSENQFGKVEKLDVKGQVTILLGSKREEKTIELKMAEEQQKQIGPFSVQVKQDEGLMERIGTRDEKSIRVTITGPHITTIAAKFKDGDEEFRSGFSMWDEKSMYYSVPKPKGGQLTMTLSYWVDVKEVKVPISQ